MTVQSPPSPSSSFYAMSDDDEGEYDTIRHTKTGKGVKLLYTKSKVYIHPTPSSKDNIAGFIALIQQKSPGQAELSRSTPPRNGLNEVNASSLLLAWVPESSLNADAFDTYVKVDLTETSSPPKQTYLVPAPPLTTTHGAAISAAGYAFSIPVTEIYSLLVRPPSIGWWFGSVVINTKAGDSFPALFFHDDECKSTILQRKRLTRENFDPFKDGQGMFWGGDEVLRWLKRYVNVERTGADPNIYLIDPTEEDRQGFSQVKKGKGRPAGERTSTESSRNAAAALGSSPSRGDAQMDPVTKFVKETRWNILEKLSQVTTFTRRTAQQVAENKNLPPTLRRLIHNPEVQQLQDEFDSARVYLARWAMGIAEQSEKEREKRIFTAQELMEHEATEVGDFELLELDTQKLALEDRRRVVTVNEWKSFFNATSGRLEVTPDEVKSRIFYGGLDADDSVRKEGWLFLLGFYDWDSSAEERTAVMNSKRDEYIRLKGRWWERQIDGSMNQEESEWWREQKNRIEKDVHRTDRHIPLFAGEDIPHPDPDSPFADQGTNVHMEQMKDMLLTYNEYNKELGYVQGMSDLLAPIYAVMQDDAIAFWAFANFMERMERNFLRDQSGMRLQLTTLDHLVQLVDPQLYIHLQKADSNNFFFFFRMLLVWYKREFEFNDVLRLWEVLWTDFVSGEYQLFIALAILEKHREVIMTHLHHFDEVLKYVNELSGTIELKTTLLNAERLFRRFERMVEAIDRKDNFPNPRVQRLSVAAGTEGTPSENKAKNDDKATSDSSRPSTSDAESPKPNMSTPRPASARGKQPVRTSAGTSTSNATASQSVPQTKVVSPELRRLLRRDPPKMKRSEVVKHGGGLG